MTCLFSESVRSRALMPCLLIGFGALCGAAFAQPAQTLRDEPRTVPPRPTAVGDFTEAPRRQGAVMDLACGNATYRLDTGSDVGGCSMVSVEGVPHVSCVDGTNIVAAADCTGGCQLATGPASCTVLPD